MTQILDWEVIEQSQEYLDSYDLMTKIIVKGIANEGIVDGDNVFVNVLAHFLSTQRYLINHISDIKDLEKTAFFDFLKSEIGFDVPTTSNFPLQKFLEENKRWFGHKGVEILYQFLGQLVGSPIEVWYPKDFISKIDDDTTVLDGAESDHGELHWSESKIGYIEDGIFYAQFTYVIAVLQAQNIHDFEVLLKLFNNIHPAGRQKFLQFTHISLGARTVLPSQVGYFRQESTDTFFTYRDLPGIDNGLMIDDGGSLIDTFLDLNFFAPIFIITWRDESFDQGFRVITEDSLLHKTIAGKPWAIFSRYKSSNKDEHEAYIKVYPDEDSVLLTNQQTNMSMSELLFDDIENLEFREIENIAYDKANQNPPKAWYKDLPMCTIEDI